METFHVIFPLDSCFRVRRGKEKFRKVKAYNKYLIYD